MCLDLGEELSEAKLKAIKVKVLEPPVMLLAGKAIPSQTYLLILKNIALNLKHTSLAILVIAIIT